MYIKKNSIDPKSNQILLKCEKEWFKSDSNDLDLTNSDIPFGIARKLDNLDLDLGPLDEWVRSLPLIFSFRK